MQTTPKGSRGTSMFCMAGCCFVPGVRFQHFALALTNLTDAPSWAIDFMKQVPLHGMKYITLTVILENIYHLARHADKWYIAGLMPKGNSEC